VSPEHFKMPSLVWHAVKLVTPKDFVVKRPELRIDVITPYDMSRSIIASVETEVR